jgi:Uma2 family endonuclease/molybdopterin-guanine dinucleotide biosynthesis protein A
MGRPKAWLPVGGAPMLVRVAERVRPLVSEIVAVRTVHDQVEDEGPLPALALGLATITAPYAIALGCDAPCVRVELLRFLADECERLGVAAVIPRWNDRLQPLVAAYDRRLLATLARLVAGGERRLQALGGVSNVRVVPADDISTFDADGESFTTVNTPHEYAAVVGTRRVVGADRTALQSVPMNPVPELAFESTTPLSQAEFAAWINERHDSHLNHYELLDGKVVMTPPAGHPHGEISHQISLAIGLHVRTHSSGVCFGSSQGFALPSGDTVEPDFSFVSYERRSTMPKPVRGEFLAVAPDLVVEILSPSTGRRDREQKRRIYDRNAVREYWIVDPDRRELIVFTRGANAFDAGETYPAGTIFRSSVIEGFELDVASVLP